MIAYFSAWGQFLDKNIAISHILHNGDNKLRWQRSEMVGICGEEHRRRELCRKGVSGSVQRDSHKFVLKIWAIQCETT
jgi:hypothetical protein